jgi:hypothetical protein
MKPSYIILTETGERLDLNQANEFNPNEYAWMNDSGLNIGLYCNPEYLSESYCYTPDIEEDDEPITATTLAFMLYDESGKMIFSDEGGNGFWL